MDMGTQGAGRKRLPNRERLTAEDDALSQIAREVSAGARGPGSCQAAVGLSVRRGRGAGAAGAPVLRPRTSRGRRRPYPCPRAPSAAGPLGARLARSWGAAPDAGWPGPEGRAPRFVVPHRGGAVGPALEARGRLQRPHGPGEVAVLLSVTVCRGLSHRVQLGHALGVTVTLVSGPSPTTCLGPRRFPPKFPEQSVVQRVREELSCCRLKGRPALRLCGVSHKDPPEG